ncbi:Uncharacterised protein [Vibrio cholerae]|nr:Uncharacterised protein [Vibrio cholerae]CSB98476.1 Uncharacterised protein [Vibrio cholerae]CSC70258.1 Uncharacterised protein [Vibrio cholerae]CSC91070.1 Uncharacterised protein [Vibrio cholerae]CSI28574.1 Uncharacterised protein [Vibrio cholerae]
MRFVEQHFFRCDHIMLFLPVTEAIRERLKHFKGLNIGLFDCRIAASRCERYGHIHARGFSRLFDTYVTSQNNRIGDTDARFSGNFL